MSPRPALMLAIVALGLAAGPVACGADDEAPGDTADAQAQSEPENGATATQTTPELTDTSVKPELERPTGVPPRRLVREDIVKGKGPAAKRGDTVLVHYVGVSFSNGTEFDASWDRGQPFPVTLGEGQVIAGWEKGLLGIRKGGRRELVIPPKLGHGAAGAPPDIGPNETLVFVIDALEIR
jgi:peptidylprolyl isomerase